MGNFADIMDRIFSVYEVKTQDALANCLGIKPASVSSSKKSQTIPPAWLLKILNDKYVNPNWILTGQGPKFFTPVQDGSEDPFESALQIVLANKDKVLKNLESKELLTEVLERILVNDALNLPFTASDLARAIAQKANPGE